MIVSANLILVYSAIAQAMLMNKAPKRVLWTGLTLSTAVALPPTLLYLLVSTPRHRNPHLSNSDNSVVRFHL
uniref:Uncharacterized protein n=1 Tax=Desertifilum tharense IPPAS B-1220 TaxID=1781255 RepID=A0ACD5GZ11_9CYAN